MIASPVHQPVKAALIMLAGCLLITLMVVFARLAAAHHAIIEVTFWRNLVGAACMAIVVARGRGGFGVLRTGRPFGHLYRAVVGLAGLCLNFWAVTLLPLAEQTALFFAMPLMTTVLAIFLLSEKVDWRRWAGVLLGFAGILIMTRPGGDGVNWFGVCVALGGAFFTALVAIALRDLGQSEPPNRTVFYFFTLSAAMSACFLPWFWSTPTPATLLWLVASGLTGTAGQLLMTRAYTMAPAGFLGPFNYLSIVYSTFFGWAIWHEWPHNAVFVGMAVVVASGFLSLALEKGRAGARADIAEAEAEAEANYG
ncbi:MAG: DMT family transporter [Alphaproteobacteria bacterium]|nr:DMT family transporter [Alphaproteobacteria bacterium]USO07978.1 MAG: DMT family transporter [Rhodospirillales bacterium]